MKNGKHIVLCVDDDQDVLDTLRMVLEQNNYIMLEAKTAEEGLQVYKKERPDFHIVDLMMEKIDAGTNFVKELARLGSNAPVYILSSVGDSLSDCIDCTELGLSGVFQKPIDFDNLLLTLRTKLKRSVGPEAA